MIIVGAKGLAKELLGILADRDALANLHFFDDVSPDAPEHLFGSFPVLRTFDQVRDVFRQTRDNSFALGLGNPFLRKKLADRFLELGGVLTSVVSPTASLGRFDVRIGPGSCILPGVVITASVSLGEGCLVNPNATISHDCSIGKFVEISPGANVTGNCTIGDYSFIGSNAVVLPRVNIGTQVIVGAGAAVTKDVPDHCVVAGVPAVVKKVNPPAELPRQ